MRKYTPTRIIHAHTAAHTVNIHTAATPAIRTFYRTATGPITPVTQSLRPGLIMLERR